MTCTVTLSYSGVSGQCLYTILTLKNCKAEGFIVALFRL